MKEKRKDFENVIEMAQECKAWLRSTEILSAPLNTQLLAWQVRAQITIAQQLTMVSRHLDNMVKLLEGAQSLANRPK